jgi:tRNA (pseudouridine54-N1)-methyltransferase
VSATDDEFEGTPVPEQRAATALAPARNEFARGAALFDTGAYWEAHEAWEGPWRRERRAWQQGLIQVAAAFHKLFAKKDVEAARRILSRAVTKLDADADGDVRAPSAAFVAAVQRCLESLGRCAEAEAFDRALVPRLVRASRRFVVVGRTATASSDFSLDDLPSTSGRLDVLVRCLRAGLLVSHGVRRDTVVYLLLLGGPKAPRALRADGATARFLRPDERSLATLVRKSLAASSAGAGFVTVRPGIAVATGGLDVVLADLGAMRAYVLDERGLDFRSETLRSRDDVFFVGDHLGFDESTRALLLEAGARSVSVGPIGLHAEDAVTVLSNELDRGA